MNPKEHIMNVLSEKTETVTTIESGETLRGAARFANGAGRHGKFA